MLEKILLNHYICFLELLNFVKERNENRDCRKTPPTSEGNGTFRQEIQEN